MYDDDTLECLDDYDGDCEGAIERHPSFAGTGTMISRCTKHYDSASERAEEVRRSFPDAPTPPSWFDPSYAGERWDEDE